MRPRLFALLIAAVAAPALAQDDFSRAEIKVERLAPGVAVLFGPGGNIGLSYGADGNVLIDDQYAPVSDKVAAAIATLDRDPVKFVINTHWHGDHTGGNENFGKRGAVILAHDNVRTRMTSEQVMKELGMTVPPSPAGALPVVTFGDGVTLHINGDTLHVIHVAHAHTDGDALVHWEKADVLHMGHAFFLKESFPFIDLSSGGSIDGLIAAANLGLALAKPTTKIIPGHGPVGTRADLLAYRDMLVDVRAKVAAAIAGKQTLAQLLATRPVARYGMPDGFIKPDQFVTHVHASLTAAAAQDHPHAH